MREMRAVRGETENANEGLERERRSRERRGDETNKKERIKKLEILESVKEVNAVRSKHPVVFLKKKKTQDECKQRKELHCQA